MFSEIVPIPVTKCSQVGNGVRMVGMVYVLLLLLAGSLCLECGCILVVFDEHRCHSLQNYS